MSKLSEEKYNDIVIEQAKEFNKRMGWVNEMLKLEQYKPFSISKIQSPYFKEQVDLRDLKALSSLIPLKGENEEEIKKNFQDEVFKMYDAFYNGPINKAKVYLDKLIDIQLNFDESKLDYSKKEDVFKAISYASLGQCFGTKSQEFKHYYNSRINNKELKEKFYYRNIAVKNQLDSIFGAVNSKVKLDITITLFSVDFSFEPIYMENLKKTEERDLKQVEALANKKDEVINLDYVVDNRFAKANNPNTTNKEMMKGNEVTFNIDLLFQDVVIPGGTEGKFEIERYGFVYQDCVFVNGKPLREAYKGSQFDIPNEVETKKMGPYLAKMLTDPTAMVEICKLIPVGANEFKKQFIPVHKNFKELDPTLQKTHDDVFNAFVKEGYKQNRDNEAKYVDKILDNIKHKEAIYHIDLANQIKDPLKDGARPTYKDYDSFFIDNNVAKVALNRFEHAINLGHKFEAVVGKEEVNHMSTIELRQGLGMALIMAGKDATDEEIYRRRFDVLKAYKAGGEFKREYNREYIKKVLSYDITKVDFKNQNSIYEYLTFVIGSSAVSNIFEEDPILLNEFTSDPIMKNKIAINATYTMSSNEFLGGKIAELMGGIPNKSFSIYQFDVMGMTDCSTLNVLEAKRMLFDITNAKINAIYNNETEHSLMVPYFLSGNACGSTGDVYSFDKSQKTVDDYLNYYDVRGNELIPPSGTVIDSNIESLAIGCGSSLDSSISYLYQTKNQDNIAEFAEANKLSDTNVSELCTYINGVSLKELIDGKIESVIASKQLNPNNMTIRESNILRDSIKHSFLAEALTNPSKIISLVNLKSNENNELEIKTTVLKKDYSALVKNEYSQYSLGKKILHFFHLVKFDADRVVAINKETIRNYKASNQSLAITESFKTANKELLLKHQVKFAKTDNLKEKAFNELKLGEKTIKNVREQFLNEKIEINDLEVNEKLNRPHLDKISTLTKQVEVDKSNYADEVETKNFNRKYQKGQQIEVDLTSNDNVEEEKESIVGALEDSVLEIIEDDEIENKL